ncbi:hypothetical protein E2C01_006342 [Portunus trituberculatus]|uniref:Uncharacterized protein n=1 Tax=Portunus trituberculatus TaxID=210409 RepID=A0A5B7CUZ1_PORTR|nr:hypothetical protein [Portunus trituberculatus]
MQRIGSNGSNQCVLALDQYSMRLPTSCCFAQAIQRHLTLMMMGVSCASPISPRSHAFSYC